MVKIANTYGNDDDDNLRDLMSDQFIIIEGFITLSRNKDFFMSALTCHQITCTILTDLLYNGLHRKSLIRPNGHNIPKSHYLSNSSKSIYTNG